MRHLLVPVCLAALACTRGADSAVDSLGSVDSVAPAAPEPVARDCGVNETTPLTERGLGELRYDRPIAEVAARCEVVSDSPQRGTEGMMERVVVVRAGGELVQAIVDRDKVQRILINTPRFRTADSLGVDTPLRRIASMRGAQFAPGEDGVYGFSPDHCGLSFRFSLPLRPPTGGDWTAAQIAERHGDAAVNRVLVRACSP